MPRRWPCLGSAVSKSGRGSALGVFAEGSTVDTSATRLRREGDGRRQLMRLQSATGCGRDLRRKPRFLLRCHCQHPVCLMPGTQAVPLRHDVATDYAPMMCCLLTPYEAARPPECYLGLMCISSRGATLQSGSAAMRCLMQIGTYHGIENAQTCMRAAWRWSVGSRVQWVTRAP